MLDMVKAEDSEHGIINGEMFPFDGGPVADGLDRGVWLRY